MSFLHLEEISYSRLFTNLRTGTITIRTAGAIESVTLINTVGQKDAFTSEVTLQHSLQCGIGLGAEGCGNGCSENRNSRVHIKDAI